MRLGFVAALVLASACLPIASAQAPDPASVVAEACATVGGIEPRARELLPACPRADPAAPSAAEEAAAPAAPAPEPVTPGEVADLATGIVEEAKEIPNDPAGAPERLLAIVGAIVAFVQDLLDLPAEFAGAVGSDLGAIGARLGEGAGAVRDAAASAVQAVKDLFTLPAAREPAAPLAPALDAPRVAPVADGLLARVQRVVG